ncbi:hypothetical protein D3C72_2353130 [compost metagenome]
MSVMVASYPFVRMISGRTSDSRPSAGIRYAGMEVLPNGMRSGATGCFDSASPRSSADTCLRKAAARRGSTGAP